MMVQLLKKEHIQEIANIASQHFGGMSDIEKAVEWVCCNFRAFPRMQYFVAKDGEEIVGYILWVEKGGFRQGAVYELEQIAVSGNKQGNGVGTLLIEKSLEMIKVSLQKSDRELKLIEVTTGVGNKAQNLYTKTLGVTQAAVIEDYFHGDEIIMLVRF